MLYRLRFFDGARNQYGVIYLESDQERAEIMRMFELCAGTNFTIKHLQGKHSFSEMLI